jgi:hypothetical protein
MTQTSATSDFATHEIQILNLHKIDLIALSFSKNNHYYFYSPIYMLTLKTGN